MRLVIVGAGPAGVFAAITAAENCPGLEVVVLEREERPLRKLEGRRQRPRLTLAESDVTRVLHGYVRGHEFMEGWLPAWTPQDMQALLRGWGVDLHTTAAGTVEAVLKNSGELPQYFLSAAEKAGVKIHCSATVTEVAATTDGFRVWLKSGPPYDADFLLLATGSHVNGIGYGIAQQFGHSITPAVQLPAILTTRDARLRRLGEVRVPGAAARLPEFDMAADGGVDVLQQGLAGPAVLELATRCGRELAERDFICLLIVNWVAELGNSQPTRQLRALQEAHQKRAVVEDPPFELPAKLWERLVAAANLPLDIHWGAVSQAQLQSLAGQIVGSRFKINGRAPHRAEWFSSGGVPPAELIPESMESRFRSRIYFAGEILDIDGIPGGYNLQTAWTTARIAGLAIASRAAKAEAE